MEFEQMTLKEFAAWLRSQPADRVYNDGLRSECCPIACYTGRMAAAYIYGMPSWASFFIERFDEMKNNSQESALKALELTEQLDVLSIG